MAVGQYPSFEFLVLFDTVTVFSFVLITLIIATAYFSKYVHRRKAWYGQMVQWMIYCMSYMLLFGLQGGPQPPRALCLFQTSLIYACPAACAVGSACFMIDFYMSISPLHRKPTPRMQWPQTLLILLPWVTLVCTALQVVLFTVASHNLDTVNRSDGGFTCNISNPEPTIVSVILVLLAILVWFYYEAQAGIIMYQNRLEFSRLRNQTSQLCISLYIRSAIFTVGMLIGTGVTIYSLSTPGSSGIGTWTVSLPFMPIFVALVFGTQTEIMRVWLFWRKRRSEDSPLSTTLLSFTIDEMLLREPTPIP